MFVHLHLHSPFSFLDGASRIQDLVQAAAGFEMPALAVTDHNNVSAAVRFHQAAMAAGIKPILGAEVTLEGGHHLTLLAQNARGYANLCQLLTDAHLSQPRLQPAASLEALRKRSDGLIALSGCRKGEVPSLILRRRFPEAEDAAGRYREMFGADHFFLELQNLLLPGAKRLNARLVELARHLGVRVVGTNNVHYLHPQHFVVHDVLTCARTLTKLDDVHRERPLNAQAYLRSPTEMKESLAEWPEALEAAGEIAERCEPALSPGKYRFPDFAGAAGEAPYLALRRLAEEGARWRYDRVTGEVERRLNHELSVIHQLGFENYFLAVWDLVQFARQEGIRYAGRGSAADSLVAYCLGITGVDPIARRLLFARFMSLERAAPPDIDLDFQAERRDEVTHYVIEKYGREHVAGIATYNTFQARSAVRDLGKAMGFPQEDLDYLARRLPYLPADAIESALGRVPELRDSEIPHARYQKLLEICRAVAGFPRHLSTHLGGLVITGQPVNEISPLQMAAKGIPIIQFDKDDVEDLGLVKLDLLSLRMLAAVEHTVDSIRLRQPDFDYDSIPPDDQSSYRLVASTDTVGVFQLESPAQRALHARLQPNRFEDLVASVAIIRPGPILANMVAPYLARRSGREPVTYLHPALERILAKTYGVVLFQEQVIEIATEIAGFTPGEADKLRRAMTHHRSWEEMEQVGERFIQRARERGVSEGVAKEIFSYIRAYAGYGFCEAHAAAFADTAYKTAYLKSHHPAEFYAGLLSCQPMGFYPSNTLVWEAKRRGICVRGPEVNRSEARFTVEDGAIRIGLAQVRGMGQSALESLLTARRNQGSFRSLADFCRRVKVDRTMTRDLLLCGAMDSLCANRRQALWQLDELLRRVSSAGTTGGLGMEEMLTPAITDMPDFSPAEEWHHEFEILDIALREHPVGLVRKHLRKEEVITTAQARRGRSGRRVKVAGLVIRPHRPPTKSGRTVVFLTLEDETEMLDVTVFESVYQRCGAAIFTQPMLVVTGRLDRRGHPRAPAALVAEQIRGLGMHTTSH